MRKIGVEGLKLHKRMFGQQIGRLAIGQPIAVAGKDAALHHGFEQALFREAVEPAGVERPERAGGVFVADLRAEGRRVEQVRAVEATVPPGVTGLRPRAPGGSECPPP